MRLPSTSTEPQEKCFADVLHILRHSLSKALVILYPLAGRLHWIHGGRVELHCNDMGALLVEAESNSRIDDFGDFTPTPEIRALIPSMDFSSIPLHEVPLVLVQLTKFSCGGISLGLGISHVVADGQSALHFITEWARIARGGSIDCPPFLDRTILRPSETLGHSSRFDHLELSSPPSLIGQGDNLEERRKPTTVAMLKLSGIQIDILKKRANGDQICNKNGRNFTRFQAIAGHTWRCTSNARGHKSQQQTRLDISVDFRNRMEPPLAKNYFGNAQIRALAVTTTGDLLSKPLGFACNKIREAVEKITDEYLRSYLVYIKTSPDVSCYRNFHTVGCSQGAFYGNPNMEGTSWAGLQLYAADFGWGKEIYMGPGAIGFDGKFFIIPGPDGDGSFNVILRLQVEHMDAFKGFFYEDI